MIRARFRLILIAPNGQDHSKGTHRSVDLSIVLTDVFGSCVEPDKAANDQMLKR